MANDEQGVTGGRGADTRARLIAATAAVIAEDGWAGVTTRSVAERAGVNPALVHYHFGSVAALRRAAAMDGLMDMAYSLLAPWKDAPDVLAELRAIIDATVDVDLDRPESVVLVEAMLQAPREPELGARAREVLDQFRELLADRLAAGQAEGLVRGGLDPRGVAILLAAALDGLFLHRLIDPSMDLTAARTAFMQLLEVDR